ncbi:hypothetical protein Ptr902_12645 [Pyrenophora tritici-repentis]|nr:hypothetical protein Ptr902_12645 [Pyrenophora tritici-repentis]
MKLFIAYAALVALTTATPIAQNEGRDLGVLSGRQTSHCTASCFVGTRACCKVGNFCVCS